MRRRTTTGRVTPAGSSRGERLDPLARPLQREVFSRPLSLPLAAYRGIVIRLEPPAGGAAGAVAIVLAHSNPALSRTLYRATHGNDVIAEWRAWGRALALPLLVAEADGNLREPFARIGAVRVGRPAKRPTEIRHARRGGRHRRAGRARCGLSAAVQEFGSAPPARPA